MRCSPGPKVLGPYWLTYLPTSSLWLNHQYTFFSFYPPDPNESIINLQETPLHRWLQLFKLSTLSFFSSSQKYTCPMVTNHSARKLGFIFGEHLSFSDQTCILSKSSYSHYIIVNFAVSVHAFETTSRPGPIVSRRPATVTIMKIH